MANKICYQIANVAIYMDLFDKLYDGHFEFYYEMCPGGGGGTPLYGLDRYVRPQRVGFFSRFGHK